MDKEILKEHLINDANFLTWHFSQEQIMKFMVAIDNAFEKYEEKTKKN